MENKMVQASAAITLTEERTFSAKLGGRTVTGLAVASAWEGFTKYTDRNGQHLIVLDADQRVITASPDLIAQLGLAAAESTSPFTVGAYIGGGYFTGIITVEGKRYALITAGAEGELRGAWHTSTARIEGAVSRRDGKANTLDMDAAGIPLAKQAAALNIGGLTDWYLPSRDELELMYRAFKPTEQLNYADGADGINPNSLPTGQAYTKEFPGRTDVENFRGGADALADSWYWSSTQHASSPSYAWIQHFYYGGQTTSTSRTRAGRALSADWQFSPSSIPTGAPPAAHPLT
jgi:hypothetical protein